MAIAFPGRLHPGGSGIALQLPCMAGACRLAWNEIKSADESQQANDCGRKMAPSTILTSGLAFAELRKQHEWPREHSFSVVRYSMSDLAEAQRAFFRSREGYPKRENRFQEPAFTILQDMRGTRGELSNPESGRLRPGRRGVNPYANSEVLKRIGRRWNGKICREVSLAVQKDGDSATSADCCVKQIADCDEIHRQPNGFRLFETKYKRYGNLFSRTDKGINWRS